MGYDYHGGVLFRQFPDDAQHLPGKLRIQRAGRLVKAENIRLQSQRPGDGDTLLLPAGKLMRIVSHPVFQTHVYQKCFRFRFNFIVDLLFSFGIVGQFLCQQLACKHHILLCRVLREQIKVLKYKAEMQAFFPYFPLQLRVRVLRIKEHFTLYGNDSPVGDFQKVQTAQKRGLSRTRGPDDAQRFPLFQGKADALQNLSLIKMFVDIRYIQNGHVIPSSLSGSNPASFPAG